MRPLSRASARSWMRKRTLRKARPRCPDRSRWAFTRPAVPIGLSTALGALRFPHDHGGTAPRDLIPFIGIPAKSRGGCRQRPRHHSNGRGPYTTISRPSPPPPPPGEKPPPTFACCNSPAGIADALDGIDGKRFPRTRWPSAADRRSGAISSTTPRHHARSIGRGGGEHVIAGALYRKKISRAPTRRPTLTPEAWCWNAGTGTREAAPLRLQAGTVHLKFSIVAKLSWSAEVPARLRFLASHALPRVSWHLPRRIWTGPRSTGRRPGVGLTLSL